MSQVVVDSTNDSKDSVKVGDQDLFQSKVGVIVNRVTCRGITLVNVGDRGWGRFNAYAAVY